MSDSDPNDIVEVIREAEGTFERQEGSRADTEGVMGKIVW